MCGRSRGVAAESLDALGSRDDGGDEGGDRGDGGQALHYTSCPTYEETGAHLAKTRCRHC